MNFKKILNQKRERRKKRVRAKIFGTAEKPRLSIFRSNRYTLAQLIDDEKGKTLISASTKETANSSQRPVINKVKQAEQLGELVAKKASDKGIKKIVFDRGSYKYHGRVKAVAEGLRKGGLQ
jgi:large subunit ribosomal protein L18